MKPGELVLINYPPLPQRNSGNRLAIVLEEFLPRLPGGPTRFKVFTEDNQEEVWAIACLKQVGA